MNIKEIAKRAEVSISTVSRVINNTAKVSDEVRQRVEEVLRETNYRPNSLARELQQKRTNTIGVLMSATELELMSISASLNAITDVLKANGYSMMLANSRFDREEEFENFKVLQEKRVDGILYFAAGFTEKHYEILKNYPIPIVIIGQKFKYLNYPCVIHPDYEAACAATEYLIAQGHRKIGFIGNPKYDEAAGIQRKRAFEDTMRKNSIQMNEAYIATGDFSLKGGYAAMGQIIRRSKELPSAIFAATDYTAIGAIRYLLDHGYLVPADISVIGFDDVSVSAYVEPPLTTIHSDKRAIGSAAARHLLRILNDEVITETEFRMSYRLIERKSVRKI